MRTSGCVAALLAAAALGTALCAAPGVAAGTDPQSKVPRFSAAQVRDGRTVYAAACGACHGFNLQGAAGPALTGIGFAKSWMGGTRTARNLFDVIRTTMPTNRPGSLSREAVLDLTSYILLQNGLAAGARPLRMADLDALIPPGSAVAPTTRTAALTPRSLDRPEPPREVRRATGTAPTDAELLQVAPGNWLTFNRDYPGDRFAPLGEITTANVASLQPHCLRQLGELGSFETSPVVYDGTIYLTTVHKTLAIDGRSCAVRWLHTYVPVDPEHLPGNRGVALYRGNVYRGTSDAHLLSLDAETGALLWDVRVASAAEGYEITGAPIAYEGRVFTADAGADVGIMGRVHAFDATSGRNLWNFDIVPAGREPGAETWGGGNVHAGGASWSSLSLDPDRRLLLVPTGNPAPDFDGSGRPGANLYTDSVVALDPATGKLIWYVQQIPHDLHDWDTAAAPTVYRSGGRDLMAVASKNGLLYLYDRGDQRLVAAVPYNTRENVDVPLRSDTGVHVCPGALGEYNGPAYSPALDLLFVGAADHCNLIELRAPRYVPGQVYFGGLFRPDRQSSGWIRAFAARTGQERWAYHDDSMVPSGITVTAGGLVFAGDEAGWFMAMDAARGRVLYRFMTGGPIAGGISVYEADGEEYIAVASGSSSRDLSSATASATLIVFSLRGRSP